MRLYILEFCNLKIFGPALGPSSKYGKVKWPGSELTIHFHHVPKLIMCVFITVLPHTCSDYYYIATHVFGLLLYCHTRDPAITVLPHTCSGYYCTATHVFRLLLYCHTCVPAVAVLPHMCSG
jgi:hypothetical protein